MSYGSKKSDRVKLEKNGLPVSKWEEFTSLAKSIAIFLAIAFVLRASVVEAFKIPSSSMIPTLQVGDHILVNKLSYGLRVPLLDETLLQFRKPQRGDVVVFTLPDDPATPKIDESDTNIIKRIMGLPGDTLQVRGMALYINGELHSDEAAIWRESGRKDFGPVLVPENSVLLLGDNRDHSKDSRYWRNPYLEMSRIKGRAFIIYWSSVFDFTRLFSIIH